VRAVADENGHYCFAVDGGPLRAPPGKSPAGCDLIGTHAEYDRMDTLTVSQF